MFAVARDGVLPLSGWIGQVDTQGQPRNAVTVIFIFAAALLCTILPSQVAFTSLVSAGAVPTIAAYGLIALLRLFITPDRFQSSRFRLGKYAKPFYICAAVFNALVFAVRVCLAVMIIQADLDPRLISLRSFSRLLRRRSTSSVIISARRNSIRTDDIMQAVVIFGVISIFAFLSWYFTPEDKWLRQDQILKAMEIVD